jgi:hypothetical protein
MNMDKLSMDVPEEREALQQAFEQIIETIQDHPDQIILVPGTNAKTNEDVAAFAIEQDGQIMPFAVFVMPGDIVPRKSRTQKEIEEREKDKEFVLPEDARADEYIAPLSLDDFEDDDPEVD